MNFEDICLQQALKYKPQIKKTKEMIEKYRKWIKENQTGKIFEDLDSIAEKEKKP